MNRANQQPRPKRRKGGRTGEKRGAYKVRVWFVEHKLPNAWVGRSTQRQDRNNNEFCSRLRHKIEKGEWAGKVNWAGLYHNDEHFLVYTAWSGEWNPPSE